MISVTETIVSNLKKFNVFLNPTSFNMVTYIIEKGVIKELKFDEFNVSDVKVESLSDGYSFEFVNGSKIDAHINTNKIEVNLNTLDIVIDISGEYLYGKITSKADYRTIIDYYNLQDNMFSIARRENDKIVYHANAIYSGELSPEVSIYSLNQDYPEYDDKSLLSKIVNFYNSHVAVRTSIHGMSEDNFYDLENAMVKKVNRNKSLKRVLK